MSRRKLKKQINDAMGFLFADCIFNKVYVVGVDNKAADELLLKMAETHADLIQRVSVKEGKEVKGRVKAYFQKLRKDFKQEVNTLGEEIAKLGK